MINFGPVPAGAILPIMFTTYAGATGASVTLTGLAVTDIEVYKGTSMTQRASDVGYTLLDTDGIDIDTITGLHGFSIDTGDNTDSGFYTAGSFYTVVVSAVTVDSQTVNFIAATFRLVPAESVAGYPKADVSHFGGTAGTFASGRPEVNTTHVAGTSQTAGDIIADTNDIQTRLPAALVSGRMDSSVGAMAANTLTASALATDAASEVASAVRTELATELGRIDVATSTRLASASYTAPDNATITAIAGYVDTEVAAIKAKTDQLTFTTANRVDSQVFGMEANTLTASALASDAVTEIQSGLSTLTTAQVNAEVVDALATDTYAEPGQGAPAATTTIAAKIGYLYKAFRNRTTQTDSVYSLYADDGTTVDQKASVSDSGGTFERGEVTTGP